MKEKAGRELQRRIVWIKWEEGEDARKRRNLKRERKRARDNIIIHFSSCWTWWCRVLLLLLFLKITLNAFVCNHLLVQWMFDCCRWHAQYRYLVLIGYSSILNKVPAIGASWSRRSIVFVIEWCHAKRVPHHHIAVVWELKWMRRHTCRRLVSWFATVVLLLYWIHFR